MPFGPDSEQQTPEPTDFISLAGNANAIEVTVSEDAPVCGTSIQQAVSDGKLKAELLIVSYWWRNANETDSRAIRRSFRRTVYSS